MKRIVFLLTSVVLLFCGVLEAQKAPDFIIVINESNSISTMSNKAISKIFLKKITKWQSNKKVLPIDLDADNSVRHTFSKKIHGKKVSSIKAYWQKKVFSGRGVPPPEVGSETEVLDYVQKYENGIGYVSASTSLSKYKVKVLKVEN